MRLRGTNMFLGGVLLITSACSASVQTATDSAGTAVDPPVESSLAAPETPGTTMVDVISTTSLPVATLPETTDAPTTTEPEPEIFDPACVVEVKELDSLGLIANAFDDETVNVVALRAENNLPTADIEVGQLLDVCTGNGLDDITGEVAVCFAFPLAFGLAANLFPLLLVQQAFSVSHSASLRANRRARVLRWRRDERLPDRIGPSDAQGGVACASRRHGRCNHTADAGGTPRGRAASSQRRSRR